MPKYYRGNSREVSDWLVKAGLLAEDEVVNTRRIIIDITVDGIVTVYVEKYADERLLIANPPDVYPFEIREPDAGKAEKEKK